MGSDGRGRVKGCARGLPVADECRFITYEIGFHRLEIAFTPLCTGVVRVSFSNWVARIGPAGSASNRTVDRDGVC